MSGIISIDEMHLLFIWQEWIVVGISRHHSVDRVQNEELTGIPKSGIFRRLLLLLLLSLLLQLHRG
jgi:hypothetical protein